VDFGSANVLFHLKQFRTLTEGAVPIMRMAKAAGTDLAFVKTLFAARAVNVEGKRIIFSWKELKMWVLR
jgi:hypothetical protein